MDKPKMSEFVKTLTGFEILAIEDHFHREFNELGGMRALMGSVWALANRTSKVGWSEVKAMSIADMEQHFAPEDDNDPKAIETPV